MIINKKFIFSLNENYINLINDYNIVAKKKGFEGKINKCVSIEIEEDIFIHWKGLCSKDV